jgi:flagellar hook-associated protein 2
MDVSGITSGGVDVQGIVSQLMAVEREPINKLNNKAASYETKLSVFGTIKSNISGFQDAVKQLTDAGSFQSFQVNVGDTTKFSASAGAGTVAGNYTVEISSLARQQQLVTAGQTSSSAAIGAGGATTLSFDFGTISGGTFNDTTDTYSGASFTSNGGGIQTVTIDGTNNSLEGIRDAVNAANIGVNATIINDGGTSPYRLAFSSASSGVANSMSIAVSGDATLNSLLSNDPAGTQNLAETLTAQNANFSVNGVAVTKSANTVTDVIDGVTLNLSAVTTGPTNLTITKDTAAITEAANSFITSYNELITTLKNVSAYASTGDSGGSLAGDPAIRQMISELRDIISSTVTGGSLANLSDVGITTKPGVGLALDADIFNDAIANNLSDLSNLFGGTDGYATQLNEWATKSLNNTIDTRTTNITNSIDFIDQQILERETRLVSLERRYTAQYSYLNQILVSFSAQQNFVSQAFANNDN